MDHPHNLNLSIPAPQRDDPSLDIRPKVLAQWMDELVVGDVPSACEALSRLLERLNHSTLEPAHRLQALEQLSGVGDQLAEAVKDRYAQTAFPLTARARESVEREHRLLTAIAGGYKLALQQLLSFAGVPDEPQLALVTSIERALYYLSRQLLIAYRIYIPDPPGVWSELHQLYRFAESIRIENRPAQATSEETQRTIGASYKRIALMSLANPYQLMEGETDATFEGLGEWADAASLVAVENEALAGHYVLDLTTDAPPRYVSHEGSFSPREGRMLSIERVIERVDSALYGLAQENPLSLGRRLERDRLQRLRRAWAARSERQSTRNHHLARVTVVAGLSACHHHMSPDTPFTPELDEIKLHKGDAEPRIRNFSLVPKEHEPWRMQEREARFERGVETPRLAQFDAEADLRDIWERVYAVTPKGQKAKTRTTSFPTHAWTQKNDSTGGLGLLCQQHCSMRVRVGELVAFQHASKERSNWEIGTVRWLRQYQPAGLEIGIMRLTEVARAIGVRAVEGPGQGGEYFPALLADGVHPKDRGVSLIVPSAIYDTDTVLVLNMGGELLYAQLTVLGETTRSFSQFHFELVEVPRAERANIAKLQKLT